MEELIKVLLIDEDLVTQKTMSDWLEKDGFQVSIMEIDRLKEQNVNNVDVVIITVYLDISLCVETMMQLRSYDPSVVVIILAEDEGFEAKENLMELGVFRCLGKLVEAKELGLNIRLAAKYRLAIQRGEAFQTLLSAGQRIGQIQNEDKLYQQLFEEASKLIPSLNGFLISRYDEQTNYVRFPFCVKNGERFTMSSRVSGNSITEYVLREKKSLLLPYGDQIFRLDHGLDLPNPVLGTVNSEIVVPMFFSNRVHGTISIITYDKKTHFTNEHLQVIQSFAGQAAVAISIVRQLAEAKQLRDVGLMLAGKRGKEDVLAAIVSGAHDLIGADYTGLILQDEYGFLRRVRPVIPEADFDNFEEPRQYGGVTRLVIETREARIITDTYADSKVKDSVRDHGVHSMLALPLIHGNQVLGVLYAHSHTLRQFTAHDVDLWTAFASQAAATLNNTIEEEKQILDYKRLIEQLGPLDLISNLNDVLVQVATAAKTIFALDECRLAYIDIATGQINKWFSPESDEQKYLDIPRPDGITKWVIETKNPVFRSSGDTSELPQPHPELLTRGLKSMASLPLFFDGRLIGVLHCYFFKRALYFNEHLRTLMEAFCARAAIAINRAHRSYLSAIWRELDRVTASCESLEELYEQLVKHAHKALGADFSVFYPFNPTLTADSQHVIEGHIVQAGDLRTPWVVPNGGYGGGVFNQIINKAGRTLIINNLDSFNGSYKSEFSEREGIKGFVALRLEVPIPRKEKFHLAGLLFLNFRHATSVQSADLEELQSAGYLIAAGILRLHLQAALQTAYEKRNVQLRAVLKIVSAFENSNEGLDLDFVADEARQALNLDTCTLLQYESDRDRYTRRGAAGLLHPHMHFAYPFQFNNTYIDSVAPIIIEDVHNDEYMRQSGFVKRENIQAVVIYPMHAETKPLGLFFASYREVKQISSDEIEAIGLFADLAALVMLDLQLGSELTETRQKMNKRLFLTWVSMIEDSWRHSLVQKASSIRNYCATLNRLLGAVLPEDELNISNTKSIIREIDRLAEEIASAPPRVPHSWEMEAEPVPVVPLLYEVAERESRPPSLQTGPLYSFRVNADALDGIQIRGYRRWLIYLLEVLIHNSCAAMSRGGELVISGKKNGEWAEIRIMDSGIGVPTSVQHLLFKELIPKLPGTAGMGIGSLLAATLVEEHGGEIELERPGPGDTTILIRFPIMKA